MEINNGHQGMNLKITTDAKKTIKSINGDGFTLFGYEERDLLNQEFENFFQRNLRFPLYFQVQRKPN